MSKTEFDPKLKLRSENIIWGDDYELHTLGGKKEKVNLKKVLDNIFLSQRFLLTGIMVLAAANICIIFVLVWILWEAFK